MRSRRLTQEEVLRSSQPADGSGGRAGSLARAANRALAVALPTLAAVGVLPGVALAGASEDDRPLAGPTSLRAEIDAILQERVGRDTPGAVVAVVHGEETVHLEGYGTADVRTDRPVSAEETPFMVGSVGKLVTFATVLQAVEDGTVDLDEDVRNHLDDSEVDLPDDPRGPITLRHLATHTAGFEADTDPGLVSDPDALLDPESAAARERPDRKWAPGEVVAYSNYGALLAGHVVAEAQDTGFEQLVEGRILDPLGMTRSTLAQPVPDSHPGEPAAPHAGADGEFERTERSHVGWSPAGSLSASAADMTAFMRALLGTAADDEADILGPDGYEVLHEVQHGRAPEVAGMRFGLWEHAGPDSGLVAHDGATLTESSHLLLAPDEGVGVFVAYNVRNDDAPPEEVIDEIADALDLAPATTAPGEPATSAGPREQRAATVAGEYRPAMLAGGGPVEHLVGMLSGLRLTPDEDGGLHGGSLGERDRYVEAAPGVYERSDGEDTLSVDVEDGEVTALHLDSQPMTSYLPVGRPSRVGLVVGLLVGAITILLGSLVVRTVTGLRRSRRGLLSQPDRSRRERPGRSGRPGRLGRPGRPDPSRPGTRARWARASTLALSTTTVAWLLLLGVAAADGLLPALLLRPWPAELGLWLPYAIVPLAVLAAVSTGLAWREPGWSARARGHHLVVSVAGLTLLWPLAALGLLAVPVPPT